MSQQSIRTFLHVSDTHLGCAQFDLKEREQDVYDAFSEVVDTAVKDKVDAVVHAGDIFHIPKPGGTPLLKLAEGIKALDAKGIKFYFTFGEHDISRIIGTPSSYLFHKLGLATYIGTGEPVMHGDTMIIGFHKHRRGELEELVEKLQVAGERAREHTGKKILVLHQGMPEFHRFAGELRADDLPPDFDYYALGHLHDHFEKHFEGMQGPVCYPGSLDPTPGEGIKESTKGFYFVDISGAEARPNWIQLQSSRKMFHYDIQYKELREGVARIVKELESMALAKKPVLSVTVSGIEVDSAKMTAALAQLLPYCLHYAPNVREEATLEGRVLSEKPADVQLEMLSLAEKVLGTKDAASFAVNELLPALERDDTEDALELVQKAFEKSRFRGEKHD